MRGQFPVETKKQKEILNFDDIVTNRAGVGPTELVSGWQTVLRDLLNRMQPFMRPGRLVTFQNLER